MGKNPKVKVLSVTYKVGKDTHTATSDNSEGNNENKTLIAHDANATDDGDFQCIDGQLYIKVCFGGDCHWAPLGKNC